MRIPFPSLKSNRHQKVAGWIFAAGLLALCGYLGVLQYRWIGEVSVAERERLQLSLQRDLNRIGRDFNAEVTTACRELLPSSPGSADLDSELTAKYAAWRKTSRHAGMFNFIGAAVPEQGDVALRQVDQRTGALKKIAWPAGWEVMKDRLSRMEPGFRRGRGGPRYTDEIDATVFEVPLFGAPSRTPNGAPDSFDRREFGWLIFEINTEYAANAMLPELVQRYLGATGSKDFDLDVVTRGGRRAVIYESGPGEANGVSSHPDAAAGLFEVQFDQIYPRMSPGFRDGGMRDQPGRGHFPGGQAEASAGLGPGSGYGRWQIFAVHRAGSLEAAVSSTRRRNLAVTGVVFLLLAASVFALVRFTRNAQRLAKLQMDFVAGVSHELRTPLSVIHGAAYNLRGSVANNPAQVERYGALLQQESGRLKELVEQILRFSSAEAGQVIREREPVSIERVIDDAMESSKPAIQAGHFTVERRIDPELPDVLGDPVALKQALQNLVGNAAKYGVNGTNWIGITASRAPGGSDEEIEIRVADHGQGIPDDEQKYIFDAFFRGRRAIQDQIHGTGLGLNLVKKIVEAHGGSIRVRSGPMQGAEFIVRIPVGASGRSK